MQIAAFCAVTGLSRDTVRFYVRRGLLTPAINPRNGYAEYDAQQVERASVIRASKALGFTLSEISRLSAEWDAVNGDVTWQLRLLRQRLAGLDAQIRQLRTLRNYFAAKARWLESGAATNAPTLPASLLGATAAKSADKTAAEQGCRG